ncbi:beta-N-acetylhexosaminidase [Porticoccus sp.]
MIPGPLMLDLDGLTLTSEERELLQNPGVGGVIFFSRNFSSRNQIVELVDEIRAIRPELLLCVDQEGGRVQRFRDGFTRIPPMQTLGERLTDVDGDALIRNAGWLMASELLACGIDFSFAPVLDIDRNQCEVIGDRSFSDDPDIAIPAARTFIAGMHEAGMAATGKHFPGHGGVVADSHLETPYDNRSLETLRDLDLRPFVELSGELDAVMPAHIVFPSIDPDAVGFSHFWLQNILRNELQFDGVIFSDDLSMKGADLAGGYADKARCALRAGCDMVLVCNNRAGAIEVLEFIAGSDITPSPRLSAMLARNKPDWRELVLSTRWQTTAAKLRDILTSIA